jgi:hypothetical protein
VKSLSTLRAMEGDGKGVPILLRQYLKLNARLIGFNVDPNFRNALDALMMVDLTAVERYDPPVATGMCRVQCQPIRRC